MLRADLPVTRNQCASPPEGNAIPAGLLSDFGAIFIKLYAGESVPGQYLHAELHGCGFKQEVKVI